MKKTDQGPFSEGKKQGQPRAQLWEIVAKIPGLVYQFKIDSKGTYSFTFVSEGIKSFVGVSPAEICADKDLGFANIHPDDRSKIINMAVPSAQTLQQRDFVFRVKDGSSGLYKWVRANSKPDKLADGSVVWNGIMMDITRDKMKEENRIAVAEEVNRELESFSYTVSHDLQTPLRSILGYTHILMNEHSMALNPEVISYLKIIEINAKRMSVLTKDLLSFSRLGKTAVKSRKVNMGALVNEVTDELAAEHNNSKTKIIIHNLLPAMCDAALIKQVWHNLIGNACKYSSKKENPVIEIGMSDVQNGPVYYIKDNGAGFDMKYAGKLFTPFERIHSQEEFEGSGIGLATVHRIITKHGGRVWAEAKPGDGACFYFSLPELSE